MKILLILLLGKGSGSAFMALYLLVDIHRADLLISLKKVHTIFSRPLLIDSWILKLAYSWLQAPVHIT